MASSSRKQQKGVNGSRSALLDFVFFLIKTALVITIAWLLFHYVFGVQRYHSADMNPAVKDGDIVFYYRLGKEYASGDIIVMKNMDNTLLSRVIAVGGDTVDMDENGLLVNGVHVQENDPAENDLKENAALSAGNMTFPMTLIDEELFVLGDNREQSKDSRTFGTVKKSDALGKVIGLFRRRGL